MTQSELPQQGLVFWPVGNGDSTTVVIDEGHVLQVDLCDMDSAREEGAPVAAVVDRLVEALPEGDDGKPHLAVFILTHADRDHCLGFEDLLDRVTIGEIWATPRLWREYTEAGDEVELCEDAKAFQAESERRVAAVSKAVADGVEPSSGDRIRVIGYDTDDSKHAYSELPAEYLTYPGDAVTMIDGEDLAEVFEAFIHAPFKDDCAAARNATSVAMQVTLRNPDGAQGHALFFGDLAYETIIKIITYSEDHERGERLAWDVLLAPHHSSKKVMYVAEDGKDVLKQDVLDGFERHAASAATIVISSAPFPDEDQPGDNPPHIIARNRYEELTDVTCTSEDPSPLDSIPIVFALGAGGLELAGGEEAPESAQDEESSAVGKALVAGGVLAVLVGGIALARKAAQSRPQGLERVRTAIAITRGDTASPQQPVGFGRE